MGRGKEIAAFPRFQIAAFSGRLVGQDFYETKVSEQTNHSLVWGRKKNNKQKTHKHFSDGPCGTIVPRTNLHPSQGQTGQNSAFTLELNRKRPVFSRDGSQFVPGRGPDCPRDGFCLSRTPSRPKCLCLLVFSCPISNRALVKAIFEARRCLQIKCFWGLKIGVDYKPITKPRLPPSRKVWRKCLCLGPFCRHLYFSHGPSPLCVRKRQKTGNQGLKKSVEIGHGSSAPLWLTQKKCFGSSRTP